MTGRPDDSFRGYDDPQPTGADRPLTGLLTELANETTTLVRKEVELAKVEMSEKVNQATTGAVSLAAGGMVAFAGVIFLLLALTYYLATLMEPWLAALIVGGVVTVIGIILVSMGKSKLAAKNLQPNRTISTLQDDKDWAKAQMGR
ncbi:phage holin family protein [Skermanella pratensis]|uniref:phage holin family protein n=1 Tax=Skermanella pratensis TaxID=2233999 RepID=UPI0013012F6B|nr:phage holin family protein [Skermanella pratensis]